MKLSIRTAISGRVKISFANDAESFIHSQDNIALKKLGYEYAKKNASIKITYVVVEGPHYPEFTTYALAMKYCASKGITVDYIDEIRTWSLEVA